MNYLKGMGVIFEYLKKKDLTIDPCLIFLKNFLSEEKVTMLKSINEDNIINEEIFCDFYLSNKYYFDKLSNESGFISYFELMTIIYLLKENNIKFNQIITNIFNLFSFEKSNQEILSTDDFYFIVETFINSIQKIFGNDFYSVENENMKEKLEKEIDSYYITIFKSKNIKEIKRDNIIQLLNEDPDLFNLLFYIREKRDKLFN